MVGYVHITKDKDVMTVIPKMLMVLYSFFCLCPSCK